MHDGCLHLAWRSLDEGEPLGCNPNLPKLRRGPPVTALEAGPYICSDVMATCRDPQRFHIRKQPKTDPPGDDGSAYWFEGLRLRVELEL